MQLQAEFLIMLVDLLLDPGGAPFGEIAGKAFDRDQIGRGAEMIGAVGEQELEDIGAGRLQLLERRHGFGSAHPNFMSPFDAASTFLRNFSNSTVRGR